MNRLTGSFRIGFATALLGLAAQSANAQRMSGEEIIENLQDGGYALVMRQAAASLDAARNTGGGGGFGFGGGRGRGGEPPPEPTEEALEQRSTELLTGMRHAIWEFGIPIGAIYTGPERATREQADEIPFAEIMVVDALGAGSDGAAWLGSRLAEMPMTGTNTVVITHDAQIQDALDLSISEGETLIVRPGDGPTVVGRLNLREWSVLAIELGGS
jgi:hypothetical protein